MIDSSLTRRLDLKTSTERELGLRNRLLPAGWGQLARTTLHAEVEAALRLMLRRGASGAEADYAICNKGWRGVWAAACNDS